MHADALQLNRALAREVRLESTEQELRRLRALCGAQPYLSSGRVRDLLYVVAATRDPHR